MGDRSLKCVFWRKKRISEPTLTAESWFLSGCYPKAVYVVPYSAARYYVRSEIEREGFHRSGCTPIVLFPRSDAGEATREWVERIFAAMDEVRRPTRGRRS
jgi:hypothetical protein